MSSDPQFGANPNPSDPHTFRIEEPERKRSWWQTCLFGCLGVFVVFLVVAVVAGFWLARHGREFLVGLGSHFANRVVDASDLPPQEKVEVKVQVDRIAKAFADRQISNERALELF